MILGITDDSGNDVDEIPLPSIKADTLNKIIEYLNYIESGKEAPQIERPLRTPNLQDAVVD
jgi:hypothetical protein